MRTRYDRAGRPERREIYRRENPMRPAEAWHWQYDSRHNLLSETQICDYRYQGYSYDEADHILRQDTSFRGSSHWQYDAAGNLLEAPQSGQALKHNQQHQLRQKACVYDVYGRLIQKPGPGGIWHYRYDSEHRMTEAVMEAPAATGTGSTRHEVSFSYDPLGRRTEKRSVVKVYEKEEGCVKETQQKTRFVWEGLRLLAEERNGLPLVYVYEDAGSYTPLARVYGSGEKQRVDYYRCRQNGMPQALTDEEGQLHWRLDADVWGETRAEYAGESSQRWIKEWSHAPEENLRFAGQYLDRETGLHYNTFRYYAPDMGRFITPDPVGLAGGINLYQYAPNPLSWIDPLGLFGCGPKAQKHILHGDGPGSGGHMWPGQPGKTTFPQSWDSKKIISEVDDIVNSPSTKWYAQQGTGGALTKSGKAATWVAWEVRDGVQIRVVYQPVKGRIVTAFPDSGPIPRLPGAK